MTPAAAAIEVRALPGERGWVDDDPLVLCGCCCCCCCCCAHTLGGIAGAVAASAAPALEAASPAGGPRNPRPRRARGPDPAACRVLGAFALYQAAESLRRRERLSDERFEVYAQAIRARAEEVWGARFPGARPHSRAWIKDRLDWMVVESLLPLEALEHFQDHFAASPPGVTSAPVPRGSMAHLWKLHLLYQEVAAAVDAGVILPSALPAIRDHLFEQALRVAEGEGLYCPGGEGFHAAVLTEARELAEEISPTTDEQAGLAALLGMITVRVRPSGSCAVCGELLSAAPRVDCAACSTPMHEACWSYNGRCATFACGCTQTASQAPAPDQPLVYDLTEGRTREVDAAPAGRAVALYWMSVAGTSLVAATMTNPLWLILIFPAVQLVAVVPAALMILGFPTGRRAGLAQLGRIAAGSFLGAAKGAFVMWAAYVLLTVAF